MARSEQFSTVLRYLRAGLRTFRRRPVVCSSVAVLVVTAAVAVQSLNKINRNNQNSYRANPTGVASLDTLSADPSAPAMGNLPSADDSAIGADIDNLPLLLNQLNGSGQSPALSSTEQNAQAPQVPMLSPTPLVSAEEPLSVPDRALSGQDQANRGSSEASRSSSFNYEVPPTLDLGGSSSANRSPSSLGSGSSVPSTDSSFSPAPTLNFSTPNVSPATSPLQSALERNSASGSTNSSPAALPQSSADFSSGQTDRFGPETAPPPGTTGYVLPQSLRSTPTPSPTTSTGATANPGFSSGGAPTVGGQAVQPVTPNVSQPQAGSPSYSAPSYGVNSGFGASGSGAGSGGTTTP